MLVMMMQLNKLYEDMYLQIKLNNEAYTDKEMKKVYREIKRAMNQVISNVSDIFVTYGLDGKLNLTSKEKAELSQRFNEELKKMGSDLAKVETTTLTEILEKVAIESYYLTAYVMDYGVKTQIKLNLIRQEFIDSIVEMKFHNELYSDRIWKNKDSLIKKIRLELEESMKGKKTLDQVAKAIKKEFAVKTYEASRIAVTECARVQASAQLEIGKSAGAEWVMWLATLDKKTNPKDASLDGKRWRIDEDHPIPPLHPNCRCTLVNVPNDTWTPKKRKDNESKEIIDYKDYVAWLKERKRES
jgi:SPP1 gp7 family putative phage head morphogenesis protein